MTKRQHKQQPELPLPAWLETYFDGLKADLREAKSRVDWDRTPAYERAFFQDLIHTIDSMAKRWALDVAHLEDSSRTLLARLHRLPGPPSLPSREDYP